mmetsp:Transcript_73497/g.239144  ORF Transcript_73497/g.239144 Transcript_73497/m.239144 type:complete len:210 (-) Transcript_73497:379-1008(-)
MKLAAHCRCELGIPHRLAFTQVPEQHHHQGGGLVRALQVLPDLGHVPIGIFPLVKNFTKLDSCLSVEPILLGEFLDLSIQRRHTAKLAHAHVFQLYHQQAGRVLGTFKTHPQSLHVRLEGGLSFFHLLVEGARRTVVQAVVLCKLSNLRGDASMLHLLVLRGDLLEPHLRKRLAVHRHAGCRGRRRHAKASRQAERRGHRQAASERRRK